MIVASLLTAADGDTDPQFGINGAVPINPLIADGHMVTVSGGLRQTSNGRLVVVGQSQLRSSGSLSNDLGTVVVSRLLPNGDYDTSFAGDGRFRLMSPDGAPVFGYAATVDALDRVVLAISSFEGLPFWLVRLTPNGSLDATFGTGGYQAMSLIPPGRQGFGVVALATNQSTHAIYVAGDSYLLDNPPLPHIYRFTSTGSVDTGWNSGNRVNPGSNNVFGIAVAGDGTVYVGTTANDPGMAIRVRRYSAAGSALTAFGGTNGREASGIRGQGLALSSAGVLVAGTTAGNASTGGRTALHRLDLTTGADDPGFNSGERLTMTNTTGQPNSINTLLGLTSLEDGRVAVLASRNTSTANIHQTILTVVAANGSSNTTPVQVSTWNVLIDLNLYTKNALIAVGAGSSLRLISGGVYMDAGLNRVSRDANRVTLHRWQIDGTPTLDESFGVAGIARVAARIRLIDEVVRSLPGPAGSVQVIATSSTNENNGLRYATVSQILPDGSLDPLYGAGGVAAIELTAAEGSLVDATPLPDGGLLVATEKRVYRFNASGIRDSNFGNGGQGFASSTGTHDVIRRLLVLTDGRFVAAGGPAFGQTSGGNLVVRFLANGTRDTSFGSSSRFTTSGNARIGGLGEQADGKILIWSTFGSSPTSHLGRISTSGVLDTTYGTDGWLVLSPAPGPERSRMVPALGGGWWLLGNRSANSGYGRASVVWRINDNGLPVTGFGDGGHVSYDVEVQADTALRDVERFTDALEVGGKLLLVGWNEITPPNRRRDAYVLRLNAVTGAVDTDFGSNGLVMWTTEFDDLSWPVTRPWRLFGIHPSADGRAILIGSQREDILAIRMLIGESTDPNQPPVIAQGSSLTVNMSENASPTPFLLNLNASDPDNQALHWSLLLPATNGSAGISANASGSAASISFVPDINWTGTDSFALRVSDGFLSASITVTVIVEPGDSFGGGGTPDIALQLNGAPQANGASVELNDSVVGAAPVSAVLRVGNVGDGVLLLPGVPVFDNLSNATATWSGTVPESMAPGAAVNLTVSVSPAAVGPWSVRFTLASNDPDEQPALLTLTGNGLAAETPVIGIIATDGIARPVTSGPADLGVITLSRSGSTAAALVVNVQLGGSATLGSDFELAPVSAASEVIFAAGSATATVTVSVAGDAVISGEKTVILTVQPGTGYAPGPATSATVSIIGNVMRVIRIAIDLTGWAISPASIVAPVDDAGNRVFGGLDLDIDHVLIPVQTAPNADG